MTEAGSPSDREKSTDHREQQQKGDIIIISECMCVPVQLMAVGLKAGRTHGDVGVRAHLQIHSSCQKCGLIPPSPQEDWGLMGPHWWPVERKQLS